ncbi:hypothetical protein D3C72_1836430 [compost metagenome]
MLIEDTGGFRRIGQQVDQQLHAIEKRGALLCTGKTLHASNLFRAAAPATHVETKLRQFQRHAFPQHPRPQNANGEILLLMGIERLPLLLLLQ